MNCRIRGLKMSKSLKNYTTIRSVLSKNDWTARSLRICFLLTPWQDEIEVTDELMRAVVSWEGKLNNFFLKSLDIWKHYNSKTTTPTEEFSIADQRLLGALDKAKADVDTALCDSFNTSAVMRILSDLVTESNLALESRISDHSIILLAQWMTRIVTMFGLDSEADPSNLDRIGWSGLDVPAPAKPYIYLASQLRDMVRSLARSGSVDYTAIAKLADETTIAKSTSDESSEPYNQVFQQFRTDVKDLADQQAPAKDLLVLCDQLRDVHLWDLGIYLEDRNDFQPALVRPLDKLLIEARAEQNSASTLKAKAKLEKEARQEGRRKRWASAPRSTQH
jgi:cysteinyl-tRNA synthetase